MFQSNLIVPPDVVDMEIDGEWVVVNTATGWVFVLNAAASRLWTVIRTGQDGRSLTAMWAEMSTRPADRVEREIIAFVAELEAHGLVQPVASTSSPPEEPFPFAHPLSGPSVDARPQISLALPLEMYAGSPLGEDPDPLLDPMAPLRFPKPRQ